jgi:nucleoside-diphosphate-sugar epimerase
MQGDTAMTRELHVVFGAGQVGSALARRLRSDGHRVRVVRRSSAPLGDGIEAVAGDARDRAFAIRAAQGAAVVYHCMNPSSYSKKAWTEEFPALGEAIIAATLAANARLVCLDNLYMYGPSAERVTESSPMRPVGAKCTVRAEWSDRLERARREEGLRVAVGRAGDYFGPGAAESHVTEAGVRGLLDGTRPWVLGDPSAPHAYSYLPDVVAGLAALGKDDFEGVIHLPVIEIAPSALWSRIASALGVDVRPRRGGAFLVAVLALFMPLFRELKETFYQWDRPFLIDDSKFRTRFAGLATSLERAIEATARAGRPEVAHAA